MQRFILAIGLIGASLMLQGCNNNQNLAAAAVKDAIAVKNAVEATEAKDWSTTIKAVCDAVVGEASAAQVKKLADDGKKICDGYGVGKILANPTKYDACKAKLAQYQEAIGGQGIAPSVGDWERDCKRVVEKTISMGRVHGMTTPGPGAAAMNAAGAINATKMATDISAAADYYIKSRFIVRTKYEVIKRRVTFNLAELATYTLGVTKLNVNKTGARLYDATARTPADTSAPFVMISLSAATVMVLGSAALGLKQFLQNRQASYTSPALQHEEDEEEAAGDE